MPEQVETTQIPASIGYTSTQTVTEYGVFEDRRSKGLGFALIAASEDRAYIDRLTDNPGDFPRFTRGRAVQRHPWRELSPRPADGGEQS